MSFLSNPPLPPTKNTLHTAVRLPTQTELFTALAKFCEITTSRLLPEKTGGFFISTCVGSVENVTVRFANADRNTKNVVHSFPPSQRFEVLSLVGTIDPSGTSQHPSQHIHISLGDAEGRVYGGHLISATVFTTCEIVLGVFVGGDVKFERVLDERTGFGELVVSGGREDKVHKIVKQLGVCLVVGSLINALATFFIHQSSNSNTT